MAEDADLDAELDAILGARSIRCRYSKEVPDDIKALIRQRYILPDGKTLNAWVAFSTLCRNHGADVSADSVRFHFTQGHADDR